ncbi:zinc finger protein 208-like [Zerene cesonia]|uniref:zinc finger protein 208-like n=1 Tax=Zerene cesonia TaxID=33412 RepID=UPI0018E52C85|nr:zinc finger protein 208-like [Zerene cesonia]
MDNDIDIEEHNILENPALKAIFPDITALKQELDYENEVFDTLQSNEVQVTNAETNILSNSENASGSCFVDKIESGVEREYILNRDNLFGNRIILGSKPRKRSKDYEDANLKQAKIILPDIIIILNSSPKFCKHCLILFPTVQSFKLHCKTVHSIKLYDKRSTLNKKLNEVDSQTATSNLKTEDNKITETVSNVSCFHCPIKFPDKPTLIEHLYEVLESKNKNEATKHLANKYKYNSRSELETKQSQNKGKELDPANMLSKQKEQLYSQCHICMFYFKNEKYFIQHMYNKHGNNNSTNKVHFTPRCPYCSLKYTDTKSYNKHLYNKHRDEIKEKISRLKYTHEEKNISIQSKKRQAPDEIKKVSKEAPKVTGKLKGMYFQCHICFYYFRDEKYFTKHLLNRHYINNSIIRKVKFSPKCKLCSLHCLNIKSFNKHLLNRHRTNLMGTKKSDNMPKHKTSCLQQKEFQKPSNINTSKDICMLVPKSTLFKCCKCDMNFISPKLALNHIEHMEILINWKCTQCNLIFKRNESILHIKQHQFSSSYNILEMSDDMFSKLLFCCPKCTIHFQEDKFVQHYSICEEQTPQSVHCRICDILIDSEIKSSHQNRHAKGNENGNDFIIIDLVDSKNRGKIILNKKNALHRKIKTLNMIAKKHLYYCETCKCFVSKVHKVNVHRNSQCTQIIKYPCKFCGLKLTGKGIMTHRAMHYENKDLKLQDFTFYNLRSGKKICPPIPELPQCKACNIHFLYNNDVKSHVCGEVNYKVCPHCEISMCDTVYKIHVSFHEYTSETSSDNKDHNSAPSSVCSKISDSDVEESEKQSGLVENFDEDQGFVYCCKACYSCVNSYDKVIEHCQLHLTSSAAIIKSESNQHYSRDNVVYNFDPFYYGSQSDKWLQHVYGSLSVEEINKLLLNCIYKHENRIKLEICHPGNPLYTEYKCESCNYFIDRTLLYDHIESCVANTRKFTCEICKLTYIEKESLDNHLQIHEKFHIPKSSFRIVSFNKKEHKEFNEIIRKNCCKPYVVYKCRNCEGVVNKIEFATHVCNLNKLKKCDNCGLLLYDVDYESHILRHKQLESFNGNNIKVVLLGYSIPQPNKCSSLLSTKNSFVGIVCDYSFYKCLKCDICIRDFRSISKHFCLVDSGKTKCTKCNLYFDEGKIKGHYKLHSSDPDFVKDNIITIDFDPTRTKQFNEDQSNCENVDEKDTNKDKDASVILDKQNTVKEKLTKLFKCVKCNFHFLSESSAKEHIKKRSGRLLSQKCTKCGFSFSPNNLFKHLLEHHGQKGVVHKFEVVDVIGDFKKQKIYKCSKCTLHFTNSKKMYDHYLKCLGESSDGAKCKCCGVMFHYSYLLNHERMHENNSHVDYEIVTTEDVNC